MRTILTSLLLFTGIASGTLQAGQIDEELADGIRVNAIAPGIIKTKFAAALWSNEELAISWKCSPVGSRS